jgi:3',5'-cyclic AMP phosphodiesterase CpdA
MNPLEDWTIMRRITIVIVVGLGVVVGAAANPPRPGALPVAPGSVKFAVIGDNGTGKQPQFDVAEQMVAARTRFPFEFVIMMGDNLYGTQDVVEKFERPYSKLLQASVPFFAALGNHDDPSKRTYRGFNMGGERYYTYTKGDVRFFVFDTNVMDRAQMAWIEQALQQSSDPWKIAYFHHPLYSDGDRHGSNVELRVMLEPLFVRYGVSAVFSGHEHFYERTTPQKGITYFIEGSSGQLRKGNVNRSPMTAAAFDQDHTFMLVEIIGDRLNFETISRTGKVVDSGVVQRRDVE